MDPDRWRRIDELVEAAAAREGDARAAFLAEACGDDAELRREVESLLAEQPGAEGFLGTGAWRPAEAEREDAMTGTTLGPYRVQEKLGEGGMGEVYKARDHVLGDEERAFTLLERAAEAREPFLPNVTSEPVFDDLRGHPRFRALRARMELP